MYTQPKMKTLLIYIPLVEVREYEGKVLHLEEVGKLLVEAANLAVMRFV